jgi:hypothetical protein
MHDRTKQQQSHGSPCHRKSAHTCAENSQVPYLTTKHKAAGQQQVVVLPVNISVYTCRVAGGLLTHQQHTTNNGGPEGWLQACSQLQKASCGGASHDGIEWVLLQQMQGTGARFRHQLTSCHYPNNAHNGEMTCVHRPVRPPTIQISHCSMPGWQ